MVDKIKERKEKLVKWLKNPTVLILIGILILGIVLRLYVFNMTSNQSLWWDEAEYMAKAKQIAYGWEGVDFWNPHKPILLSLISAPIFLTGLGEIGVRVLILLLSIASVTLIYFPVKEFFNDERIGIIASFLMAVYWVHIFFTGRVLVGLPATAFFLLFWYFFAKGFIKNEHPKYLYWAMFFFGIAFMFRVVYGVIAIPIFFYMLFEGKLKMFKQKKIWIAALVLLLTLSPMIIWLWTQYPSDPIGEFLGFKHQRFSAEAGAMGWTGVPLYFIDMITDGYGLGGQFAIAKWIFVGLFLIGSLFYFSDLFFGFDNILKSKELRMKLFILFFMVFLIIVWGNTRAYVEQRDYLSMTVFIFGIMGVGLLRLKGFIAKYNKQVATIAVLLLLGVGGYYQISWGIQLTKAKTNDYYEVVKQAGLWIKENSNEGDIVYSTARKQMLYYAEREVLDPGAYDHGSRQDYEKSSAEMEAELIENEKIRFIELDVVEKRSASESLKAWVDRNPETVKPVQAWYLGTDQQATLAVVYEIRRDLGIPFK